MVNRQKNLLGVEANRLRERLDVVNDAASRGQIIDLFSAAIDIYRLGYFRNVTERYKRVALNVPYL